MKLKDLREILKHYEGREWDNVEVRLWDYNNQREAIWTGGSYGFSKTNMELTFPIEVPPVDGKTIDERIKELYNNIKEKENGTKETNGD